MKKAYLLIWFVAIVSISAVKGEEALDEWGLFGFLSEASKANLAVLGCGQTQASIIHSFFDEKGQKDNEVTYDVRGVFKDARIRLDWKEQCNGRQIGYRTIATEEGFKEYIDGDTSAYLRDAETARRVRPISGLLLPSQNVAFWHGWLERAISDANSLLSSKVSQVYIGNSEVQVIELVWKNDPKNKRCYYVDPAKNGTVVKFESYHDFGKGYILMRQSDAEMQRTSKDGWYLRRFTQTWYRPDTTLKQREEVEVKNFDFVSEVSEEEFTWEGLGLPPGTTIVDNIMGGITYKYKSPNVDEKIIYDILAQPLVQEIAAPSVSINPPTDQNNAAFSENMGPTDGQGIPGPNDNRIVTTPVSKRDYYFVFAVSGASLLLIVVATVIRKRKSRR